MKVVSKMLHVEPVVRHDAVEDARRRKGSCAERPPRRTPGSSRCRLTDKAYKRIANLASRQETLNEFIFAEIEDRELAAFTGKLAGLENRLEKACLKVAIDV